MKKKKVLVIGLSDGIGGVETFYISYYRKIKDKFDIDFAYFTPTIVFKDEIESNGSKTYGLPYIKHNPFKYFKELKKVIKENNYDVIHINMLSAANILPILIAKSCNVNKIILHSHNGGTPKGLLRKIFNAINKKIISNKNYTYLACSELAGKWLFGNKTKFTVIKNALDINKFYYNEENRKKIRDKYKIGNDILIGHVGRFCEQKNHEFIVKMFEELLVNNKNYKLMLVGIGPLEDKIKQYVKNLGIEKNIIFTEAVTNVNEYYSAFDLFILPSLFEGLPVVGIESQINGVPCLFSNTISQELKIQNNVKFLSIKDPKVWIDEIVNNDKKRISDLEKIKSNGYDIEIEANKLQEIYNK